MMSYTDGELAEIGKAVLEKMPCLCNIKMCHDIECKHGCPHCFYLEEIIDNLDLDN